MRLWSDSLDTIRQVRHSSVNDISLAIDDMTLLCQFTLIDGTAYQLPDILLYIRIYLHKNESDNWHGSDMYDICDEKFNKNQ